MDVHTPEQRSYNMSKIKAKDTVPELLVRKWLCSHGYRYRLHHKKTPGKPDIVFLGRKKLSSSTVASGINITVDILSGQNPMWTSGDKKLRKTFVEIKRNYTSLATSDWAYLVVWECTFKKLKQSDWTVQLQKIGVLIEDFLTTENRQCMEIDTQGMHSSNIPSETPNE